MIDLHSHVLPNIDDGASSIEDALLMLEEAIKQGITHVMLTPHVSPYRPYPYENKLHLNRFLELKTEMMKRQLKLEISLGAEVDYHPQIMDTLNQGYTLSGTKLCLIDYMLRPVDIFESLYNLRQKGYQVIVAHVERLSNITISDAIHMKKEGAYLQVNAAHLLPFKKDSVSRFAKKLLKLDLINLVASDAHRVEDYQLIGKSYHYVKQKKGSAYAEKLYVQNPLKLMTLIEEKTTHGTIL